MKKLLLIVCSLLFATNLFAQNTWSEVWTLPEIPFQAEGTLSEYAKVIAGFDTDEDGWGEFITGYTDLDSNYVFMYEATGDNTYEMVWYYKFPFSGNSWLGMTVGDVDNNGKVDIAIGFPSVWSAENVNPPRIFIFEWDKGTTPVGENKYGMEQLDGTFEPTASTSFDVPDSTNWDPYSMLIEDVDKDGKNELVIGVRSGDRGREVLVASVDGELSFFGTWVIEYNYINDETGGNFATITGDLDNDGLTDIFEMVWNKFTLRIHENTGENTYEYVNGLEKVFGPDYGSLDGMHILDANNDGKNELFICGTEPEMQLFLIQDINDNSAITTNDIIPFYQLPQNTKPDGGILPNAALRRMVTGDPDKDGNVNLLIAGEANGQIFDLEYNGTGNLEDDTSWTLNIIYDLYEVAMNAVGVETASLLTPRLYYGDLANDMDGDGLAEYVFVNYSTDRGVWADDRIISIIEISNTVDVEFENNHMPKNIQLSQNYPNPFNPTTNITLEISSDELVTLTIYDMLGHAVKTLVNQNLAQGEYRVTWDGKDNSGVTVPTGTYVYQLKAGDVVKIRKMTYVK